jgi:hypothetical protein
MLQDSNYCKNKNSLALVKKKNKKIKKKKKKIRKKKISRI